MKILFIFLFVILSLGAFTQDQFLKSDSNEEELALFETSKMQESGKAASRIYYGGYMNLSFGSYTVIGVEPMVGYKFTEKLSAGVKLRYDYIKDKRYIETYTTSNYGGSLFSRYRFIPQLYAHVEFASYSYELFYIDGSSEREWVPFLFVGGGYSQNLGGNVWLNAQILFDVLESSNSPYDSWEPFYSIGIGVGF